MKMSLLERRFVNSGRHGRHVARRAVERLRSLPVRRGQRYLDVGCGNGAAATAGQGMDGVAFRQGDATHLPFPDASFDIVATNKTTHHIQKWREVLSEMTRVVTPGGHLIFADLAVPTVIVGLFRPFSGSAGIFTRRDLDRHFAALGLRGLTVSTSWWHYDAVFLKPPRTGATAGHRQTMAPAPAVARGDIP